MDNGGFARNQGSMRLSGNVHGASTNPWGMFRVVEELYESSY